MFFEYKKYKFKRNQQLISYNGKGDGSMKKISFALVAALAFTVFAQQALAEEKKEYTVIIKYREKLTTTDNGKNIYSRTEEPLPYSTHIMAYNKKEAEFKANEVKKDFESTCNCYIVSVEVQ
jgi:hypothetical protein